ncbi:hypothetical protein LSH36_3g23078 [Paralvinella palmiformis]|uniref:E3 ubiquitin-protein ligase n=1 Tax=Paralvinella palmiformis TaxID=53620 RepID=A0AAD9NHF0_9ANNE|nr:hypothetical protein LSH36_3g23078 [Paralvinella palmiformis]
MATGGKREVTVWEWMDEQIIWQPYISHVSNYIEQEYQSGLKMAKSPVIPLANVDSAYNMYRVDTKHMIQEKTSTGFCRSVRRSIYTSPSPLVDGIIWEWEVKSGIWQSYNSDAAQQIESAFMKSNGSVTLNTTGLPYHVDLKSMKQINQVTGFVRSVQRRVLTIPYTANSGLSSTASRRQNHSPHRWLSNKRFKNECQTSKASDNVIDTFTSKVAKAKNEDCPICCDKMTSPSGYDYQDSTVLELSKCKHQYHRACLLKMYEMGNENGSFQCPVCKCIYGTKVGNCPPGEIKVETIPTPLPGYPQCGTIIITYNISGGIQGPEHPNPGKPFTSQGFPRRGHLPDNSLGRKVSRLLQEAWKRRLTFTIGTSVTTGEQDTVVWNEIHHKTSMENISGHGYPDPNYLDNVLEELKIHGVVDEV